MHDIEVKNLSVNYGSACVIQNININIKKGDFLGIIGPNGGGKTTLLKVLLGQIKPSKGKVNINKNITFGYVPQFKLFEKSFPINVFDVILMGKLKKNIKLFHRFSSKDNRAAYWAMQKLDILEFKDKQIGQLSGGQLQKVLIARALVTDPDVLILDEPTSSIDSKTKKEIYEILEELNKYKTIIIVSHDIENLFSYVNSVACVNKTLHYHGSDEELDQETFEKVYGCPLKLLIQYKTE